jgi:hypothetical protein
VVQKSCLKRNKQKVRRREKKWPEYTTGFFLCQPETTATSWWEEEEWKRATERRLPKGDCDHMFIIDWLTAFLRLLGLSSKKARIVLLGFHLPVYPSLRFDGSFFQRMLFDIGWTWVCNYRTGQRW